MKCWRCKRDCPADSWPTLAPRIQSGSTGFGHRARSEQNMRKISLDNQLVFLDRKRNLYVYKRKEGDSVVERAPRYLRVSCRCDASGDIESLRPCRLVRTQRRLRVRYARRRSQRSDRAARSSWRHARRPFNGCMELVRYLSRHGAGRIARIAMVAPNTPLIVKTAQPGRSGPPRSGRSSCET
jgi:hypothetical protein